MPRVVRRRGLSVGRGIILVFLGVFVGVLLIPQSPVVPVAGAERHDWHPDSFWYEPWGASGVHKGIDVFADSGAEVVAAAPGVVVFSGRLPRGGEVVAMLTAGWRIYYYAHLSVRDAAPFGWKSAGERLGAVGTTGNAQGKPPHLHFSVVTLVPYPWRWTDQTQGWKRMFFLDPGLLIRDWRPVAPVTGR